jgi:signal peptidase II
MTAADAVASTGVRRGWAWLWLAGAIVVADQTTKSAIVAALRDGAGLAITDFFSLILTYNTGAAFSFLAAESGWQRWFFAAVAVAATAVIVMLLRRGGSSVYCAGLALILGGALGNLWDRLSIGKVVDFLLFHYGQWAFPAFNVADSAITVGAALLILDSFRAHRAGPPKGV